MIETVNHILVITKHKGALAEAQKMFGAFKFKLTPAGDSWFNEPTSDRLTVAALLFFADWDDEASVAFLERFRSTWAGWFAPAIVVGAAVDDKQKLFATGIGISKFIEGAIEPAECEALGKELIKRIDKQSIFEDSMHRLNDAIGKKRMSDIREPIEALVFWDEQLVALISRVLIGLMRNRYDVCAIVERMGRILDPTLDMSLCQIVAANFQERAMRKIFAELLGSHSPKEILLHMTKGGLYHRHERLKGQLYDALDVVLRKNYGRPLYDYLMHLFSDTLPQENGADFLIMLQGELDSDPLLHRLSDLGSGDDDEHMEPDDDVITDDEDSADDFRKIEQAKPDLAKQEEAVGGLVDNIEGASLANAIRAIDRSFQNDSELDKQGEVSFEMQTTKWLFYHHETGFLANFKKFLDDLEWYGHIYTDKIEEALESLRAESFDGIVVPYDKVNHAGVKFLEQLYCDRTVHVPGILVLMPNVEYKNDFKKNNPCLYVHNFSAIPQTRKQLREAMEVAYQAQSSNDWNVFESRRRFFLTHIMTKDLEKSDKKALNDVVNLAELEPETKELKVWSYSDQIYLNALYQDDYSSELTKYVELAPPELELFMTRCYVAHFSGEFRKNLNTYEKNYWQIKNRSGATAALFGELLADAGEYAFLGRFLQNCKQDGDQKHNTPSFYYLCYLYYRHFENDELKMRAIYEAIEKSPKCWRFLRYLIAELVDSYGQNELQKVIEHAMKCDFVDEAYCKLKLAESFYKSKKLIQGDQLLSEILRDDLHNREARNLVVEYNRQTYVKLRT